VTSVQANPAYQAGGPHQMIEGPRPGGGGLGAEWDAQLAPGGMRRPAGSLQLPPPLPVPDSNQRDWPRAWQLTGGKSRDYGTAAYRQWVGGYGCTVRDHVTTITAKGNSLLVFVRALETGGVTQDYKFSYVVRRGVLTHPRILSYTGHAPQGCGG